MQPACLSRELIGGLLRGRLGFHGLVVTDQTKMMGYYGMSRFDAIPLSIACGCDMILGINDIEEDVEAMKAGLRSGIVTEERLTEAINWKEGWYDTAGKTGGRRQRLQPGYGS